MIQFLQIPLKQLSAHYFMDQGIDAVKTFLFAVLIPEIEAYVQKKVFKDPKSLLQEYVQARKQNSPAL